MRCDVTVPVGRGGHALVEIYRSVLVASAVILSIVCVTYNCLFVWAATSSKKRLCV